jgi:hypothetical protein
VKKEGKGGNMNGPAIIKIHVKKDEEIFTTPNRPRVPRNGILEWECDRDYHFALNLGPNSPCKPEEEPYHAGPGETIKANVRSDAPFGEYKYTIAVFKEGEFFIEDPRFIIQGG